MARWAGCRSRRNAPPAPTARGSCPLEFEDPAESDRLEHATLLVFDGLRAALERGSAIRASLQDGELTLRLGGLVNWIRERRLAD